VEKQVYHFIKRVISHNVLDKDMTSLSYIQQVMMHRKKHNARSNITGTLRVCICSKLWFQSNCRFITNKQLFVSRGNSHISHTSYTKLIQCLYLKNFLWGGKVHKRINIQHIKCVRYAMNQNHRGLACFQPISNREQVLHIP